MTTHDEQPSPDKPKDGWLNEHWPVDNQPSPDQTGMTNQELARRWVHDHDEDALLDYCAREVKRLDGDEAMSEQPSPLNNEENIEMSATLGTVITGGRDRSGRTLRDAAAELGIHYTYLNKLEHDASPPPSDRVLTAFAHLYEIEDDLLYCLASKVPPDLRQDVTSYGVVKRLRVMLGRSLLIDEAAEIWPLAGLHEAQS